MCHSTACAGAARTIIGVDKHLYQLLGLHQHIDYATRTFVPYKRVVSDVQRGRFGCTKTRVGDRAVETLSCILSWFDTTLPSLWLLSHGHVLHMLHMSYSCLTPSSPQTGKQNNRRSLMLATRPATQALLCKTMSSCDNGFALPHNIMITRKRDVSTGTQEFIQPFQ